jgi:hypothetical protein
VQASKYGCVTANRLAWEIGVSAAANWLVCKELSSFRGIVERSVLPIEGVDNSQTGRMNHFLAPGLSLLLRERALQSLVFGVSKLTC